MSEKLKIIANEDGTFSEYDDTFDITIHCKSEEEQNEVMAKLNAPQPKMGKWKYIKKEDSYKCSLCGFPCHKDNLGAIPTEYCAGCGAVMEVQNADSN